MWYQICIWFCLFLIYSFLGWCAEITWASIDKKKLVFNRGFLIGPYCPLYGVGAWLMIFFLHRYEKDFVVLFVLSAVVCSVLEYLTGYLLEKVFHTRWWDYTHRRWNLNGRVCLGNSLMFGAAGVLLIALVNPFLHRLLSMIPHVVLMILACILLFIFLLDLIISLHTMFQIRKSTALLEKNKDNTEEITKLVRAALEKGTKLKSRLLRAFPSAKFTLKLKVNPLKKVKELLAEIQKIKEKAKKKGK